MCPFSSPVSLHSHVKRYPHVPKYCKLSTQEHFKTRFYLMALFITCLFDLLALNLLLNTNIIIYYLNKKNILA